MLQYGSQVLRAPVTVQLDPRVHTSTEDLQARLALELQIRSTMDALDRSLAAAMSARTKLPPAQAAALDGEINDVVQLDIHSSEADVLHETKLREQLGFLLNSLENAFQRPTVAEYATYKDLAALSDAAQARLKALTSP